MIIINAFSYIKIGAVFGDLIKFIINLFLGQERRSLRITTLVTK
jgi:hypothetical protein